MNKVIQIKNLIYTIRGHRVMLDSDLAMLYEVETKNLNKAVKRNLGRFPEDFMFQLTKEEFSNLRFQNGTSKNENLIFQNGILSGQHGGRRFLPYVFTEQGIAMLSSILKSERAIQVNVQIIRTFVAIRQWAIENKEINKRLAELEHYFIQYCKDNEQDKQKIYEALDLLMDRTKPSKIGF